MGMTGANNMGTAQSTVAQNTIWILLGLLAILILVRCLLVYRVRNQKEYRYGHSMTIGTRDRQEDCLAVKEARGGILAVLADGMGKAYGGSVSSSLAVETALDLFDGENAFLNPQYYFQKTLRAANNRILDRLDEGSGAASVAIALIHSMTLYYAEVGNVQVSVFRDNELIPVTEGHTVDILAKKKFQQGSLTRQKTIALLREHRLYNYIGQDEFQDIELFDTPLKLRHGDIVVLMTDGIYDTLPYTQIESILRSGYDCMKKAQGITALAEEAPGEKNNGSVIMIAV